ncbi:MAG: phenylalanyl-tRNA synthetase beta chain [Parcubacteria group bacterium Athens0714_16]|nr:MAG: phenylalanyl-tRNA synthetase beta chain [Parcubacteria group bacterium Athens0714_16]
MLISYKWLQEYFDEKLPSPEKIKDTLTMHSYEISEISKDKDDFIFDIDILPNRAHDSLSYFGITREIEMLFDLKTKFPDLNKLQTDKSLKSSDFLTLKIENPNECRRATKRLVVDVQVKESPDWLKEKLSKFGQKSINNIVDTTNFVMMETGQPVHAFDFDKLAIGTNNKKNISIKFADKGEKITTLDENNYILDEEILVIHDGKKPLDIAGIKGGIDTGIDEKTKNIVLSVCSFNPKSIRKTSKKLGLQTEASKRFEADISPELVFIAMQRLSQLASELSGGRVSEDILDEYPRKSNPYKIGISIDEINKILGTEIKEKEFEKILDKLGFEYKKIKPLDEIKKIIPTLEGKPYKFGASVSFDAPNYFDCSSLTAYLFAQAGIQIPRVSVDQYVFGKEISEKEAQFGDIVFSNTGNGKIHYETVDFIKGTKVQEGVDHCGLYLGDGKVLHTSRFNGNKVDVQNIEDNLSFKTIVGYRRFTDNEERYVLTIPYYRNDIRIKEDLAEEIGRIFGYENISYDLQKKDSDAKKDKIFYYSNLIKNFFINEGFSEVYNYAFVDSGEVELLNPLAIDKKFLRDTTKKQFNQNLDFNSVYSDLLALDEIKIFEIGKIYEKTGEKLFLSFGIRKKGIKNVKDYIEEIKNKLLEILQTKVIAPEFDDGKSYFFRVDLEEIIEKLPEVNSYEKLFKEFSENYKDTVIKYKNISQYPFVLRDIAVWVPVEIKSEEILNIVRENAGSLLVQNKLFDEYKKEDKVSYAFRLVFQSQEKTLTDEEVNHIMENVTSKLNFKNGWNVR